MKKIVLLLSFLGFGFSYAEEVKNIPLVPVLVYNGNAYVTYCDRRLPAGLMARVRDLRTQGMVNTWVSQQPNSRGQYCLTAIFNAYQVYNGDRLEIYFNPQLIFWIDIMISSNPPPYPQPNPPPYPPPYPSPQPPHRFNLFCGANGSNFQPYDRSRDLFIGRMGYGYAQASNCEYAIEAYNQSAEPVVCNWNGTNFQPYNVEINQAVGRDGFGFSQSSSCNDTVRMARSRMICNWNGSNWTIWHTRTNNVGGRVSGGTYYGYSQLSECRDSVLQAKGALVCNWSGDNWSIFNTETGSFIGRIDNSTYYGFKNLSSCREAVRYSTRSQVCNWNGSGYQPYDTNYGRPIGRAGVATLAQCLEMLYP